MSKKSKLTKKEHLAQRDYGTFCRDQQKVFLNERGGEAELISQAFVDWLSAKAKEDSSYRALRKEFQPQILKLLMTRQVQGFVEVGCGGGKTEIFLYAALLVSWLTNRPIVFNAPQLNLLSQTSKRAVDVVAVVNDFNDFLLESGFWQSGWAGQISLNLYNISSDVQKKSKDPEGDEEEAEREVAEDVEFTTLHNAEEIAERLIDAGCGDLFLICTDSMPKFTAAIKQVKKDGVDIALISVIDEFHRWQTGESKGEVINFDLVSLLKDVSPDFWAFSATPKISAEKIQAELAIDSGFWGVNVVWHAIGKYAVDAKMLRAWGYLKAHMKFVWFKSEMVKSIPAEIRMVIEQYGTDKAEECIQEIAEWIQLASYMKNGHVGLVYASKVPFIKVFMSEACKAWREKIEAQYNVKFHASHAGVPREHRDAEKEAIHLDNSSTKHVILNHSTWLMGVDLPKISYVMFSSNRTMESHNLVQAVSRGTRFDGDNDTCTVLLSMDPKSEQAKQFIQTMYGIIGGDVKHVLLTFTNERTKLVEEDDPLLYGMDSVEMALDQATAEVIEDFLDDYRDIEMEKRIAAKDRDATRDII